MNWLAFQAFCAARGLTPVPYPGEDDDRVNFVTATGQVRIRQASPTHFGWFARGPVTLGNMLRGGTQRARWNFAGAPPLVAPRTFGVSSDGHVWVCDALFNVNRTIGPPGAGAPPVNAPLFDAVLAVL